MLSDLIFGGYLAGSTPDPLLRCFLYFPIFRYRLFERKGRVPHWWVFRHHQNLTLVTPPSVPQALTKKNPIRVLPNLLKKLETKIILILRLKNSKRNKKWPGADFVRVLLKKKIKSKKKIEDWSLEDWLRIILKNTILGITLCHGKLWLVNVCQWAMRRHTFTNHVTSCNTKLCP